MSFEYVRLNKNKITFDLIKIMESNFDKIKSEDIMIFYETIKDSSAYNKGYKSNYRLTEKDLFSMDNKEYFLIKEHIEKIFKNYLYNIIVPLINAKTVVNNSKNMLFIDEKEFILIICVKSGMYTNKDEYCFLSMINRFNLLEGI